MKELPATDEALDSVASQWQARAEGGRSMRDPRIALSSVRFTPAGAADQRRGLLGFVACTVGALVLDGIAVRRTRDDGRLVLSFPARSGAGGRKFPYIRPLDDRARRDLQREILGAIGLDGGGSR